MTRLLSLALAGAFASVAHCHTLGGSSIVHLDCWQFDPGKPLRMHHHLRSVWVVYGSKVDHKILSLTPLTIPPNSMPLTGFRELLGAYQLDLGPTLRLKVDSMTRRGPIETLRFHADVQDPRKGTRRVITDVWRYRWRLLEVIYEVTTNPSIVQSEAHLLRSITLAKPAPRFAYRRGAKLHHA